MKRIKVTVEGTAPILFNRFTEDSGGGRAKKKYEDKDEAEKRVYRMSTGKKNLYIPSIYFYKSMINASSFYKIGRKSVSTILAGTIRIEPEQIDLKTNKYIMDKQPVVIQTSRIMRVRPRLDKWKVSFEIVYNEKYFNKTDMLKDILVEAGERIGIGDSRPQKKMFYGTFEVTEFKEVN